MSGGSTSPCAAAAAVWDAGRLALQPPARTSSVRRATRLRKDTIPPDRPNPAYAPARRTRNRWQRWHGGAGYGTHGGGKSHAAFRDTSPLRPVPGNLALRQRHAGGRRASYGLLGAERQSGGRSGGLPAWRARGGFGAG